MELIESIAESLPNINERKFLSDIADFQSNTKLFSKSFIWKASTETSATSWWIGICCSTELLNVAGKILALPPTSAAVERSFSKHSFIHSPKRNRLSADRAAKIVYIAYNIKYSEDEAG